MNDYAVADEHPPYMDRCREMSFGELREFLDESLDQLLSDKEYSTELPQSKQQFLELWELFREKSGLQVEVKPPPNPTPTPEPTRSRTQEMLLSLWNDRARTSAFISEARGNRSVNGKAIRNAERKLKNIEREIARLERVKEGNDLDWRKAARTLSVDDQNPETRTAKNQYNTDIRQRILARVLSKVKSTFKYGPGVRKGQLQWRLLPPEKLGQLHEHYRELERHHPGTRYDEERIEKALSLGPDRPYEESYGIGEYIVFPFPYTKKVMLECPKVGNAIFIIESNWEEWSQLTKRELRRHPKATRISHQEKNWFERVKEELGTPKSQ